MELVYEEKKWAWGYFIAFYYWKKNASFWRQHYSDVFNNVTGNIKEGLDQPIYLTHNKLQNITVKLSYAKNLGINETH